MKYALHIVLLLTLAVAACQSVDTPGTQDALRKDPDSQGTPLGNTGIRVSGSVQAGARGTVR